MMARARVVGIILSLFFQLSLTVHEESLHFQFAQDRQKRRFSYPGWSQDTNKTGLTETEKIAVLRRHNYHRAGATPPASNMIFLIWDDHLASVAQQWSTGCDFDHNYSNDYGENLSVQSTYYNVTLAIDAWIQEGESYDYATHSCTTSTCAHYHQSLLDESRKMGCGMYFCESMTTVSMSNGYFLVCNYSPATNKGSNRPYVSGTPCSNCPAAYPKCENNLCRSDPVCDGMVCNNGGQLISDICKCDCSNTGYDDATCGTPPGDPSNAAGSVCVPPGSPSRICLGSSGRSVYGLPRFIRDSCDGSRRGDKTTSGANSEHGKADFGLWLILFVLTAHTIFWGPVKDTLWLC